MKHQTLRTPLLIGMLFSLAFGFTACEKSSSPEFSEKTTTAVSSKEITQEKPSVKTVDLTIDAQGLSKSMAVIETEKGTVKFKFYPKEAPNTVNRIIELIQSDFYDGVVFHRVVPGFVVQGGDPTGTGGGGSGKKLNAEFNQRRHREGSLAMARTQDPNSADSQFYIALAPQPHLDGQYTVFGHVIEGMEVVRQIKAGDKMIRVYLQ
jgi:cyclophilin family peptidyl-prolyl cis-trans isomerase